MYFKFHVILLLNFISFYFVFYISFDLFPSKANIYYTKICEFFVGSSRPPYYTWHIWQMLEFFMKNKRAGWNHSKVATIVNFYYRFQTSKTPFVTRERAHSRDRLQKES